jgi:surface antigen
MNLADFIAAYLGVADTGDTPENKGQCVGLVEMWLDTNKRPHIWGDACDLLNNASLTVYKVTSNLPRNCPPPGAIVCWNGNWGAGHGHTAIVVAANIYYLVVFEQNNPEGSAPIVATHGYTDVLGWITF